MYVLIRYDRRKDGDFRLDMLGLHNGLDTAIESMWDDVDRWIDSQNLRNSPKAYRRRIVGRSAYATHKDRLTVWVVFDQSYPHTWDSTEHL